MSEQHPMNLLFVTEVPAGLAEPVEIVECGSCGCWHRLAYAGDCRNDNERFASPPEAAEQLGRAVKEINEG